MTTKVEFDEQKSSRQIKIGVLMSYVAIGFNILAGLFYTPWMIAEIGKADYGLYMLSLSLVSIFAMDFGLEAAVSRFLSKYHALGDAEGASRFLGVAFKLFIGIAVLIGLVLIGVYMMIDTIYASLSPAEVETLQVLYIMVGFYIVVLFPTKPFNGIMIANERFVVLNWFNLMEKVSTVVLMVGALLFGFGLYALVFVNALVGLSIIIGKGLYLLRKTETAIDILHNSRSMYRDIFTFSSWTTVIAIAQRFILNITPTILGALASSASIALFSIGMVIEGYVWTISSAIGSLFLPKVTRMTTHHRESELNQLLIRVGRIQLFIVGLIIVSFVTMGREFIGLWVGPDFFPSYVVALLLILPGFITLTQEIAYTTLIAVNQIKYRAFASLIVATVSVVLSLLLSPHYGAIGAAIAILVGNLIGTVVFMNVVYVRVLKLNMRKFFYECHVKIAPALIFLGVTGLLVQRYFPVESLVHFLFKVLILGGAYFLFLWMFTFRDDEKELLRGLVRHVPKTS